MKTRKLTPKQIIGLFLAALALFTTMACDGPEAGDAMDLTCSANPFDANCDAY